jgi:NADPH:quinone reductase-like Zn-dependent oxidoreductase
VDAKAGDLVVVYGVAVSIGTMLISLLRNSGVNVLGQVRDAGKAAAVEAAGARVLVACDETELLRQVAGEAPVAAVDPLGGTWTQAAVELLPARGRIVKFGALAGPMTLDTLTFYRKGLSMRGYSGLAEPHEHARCVAEALSTVAQKRLLVEPLLREYPLADAGDAFASLVAGDAC